MSILISIAGAVNLAASILTILAFALDCVDRFRRRKRSKRRNKMMER